MQTGGICASRDRLKWTKGQSTIGCIQLELRARNDDKVGVLKWRRGVPVATGEPSGKGLSDHRCDQSVRQVDEKIDR